MYTLHVQPFCTACLTGQEDERLFYMLSNAIFCYHLLFCDVHSLKKIMQKARTSIAGSIHTPLL